MRFKRHIKIFLCSRVSGYLIHLEIELTVCAANPGKNSPKKVLGGLAA